MMVTKDIQTAKCFFKCDFILLAANGDGYVMLEES